MWTTVSYQIVSAPIRYYPYPCLPRTVWFLDAIQQNEQGTISQKNICSGTKEYCEKIRNQYLLEALEKHETQTSH